MFTIKGAPQFIEPLKRLLSLYVIVILRIQKKIIEKLLLELNFKKRVENARKVQQRMKLREMILI